MALNRKSFLKQSLLTSFTFAAVPYVYSLANRKDQELTDMGKRKFTMQLNGGLIGLKANQLQLIDLAAKYGFETVVALANYLSGIPDSQMTDLKADMNRKKLAFGLGQLN